MRRCRGFLNAGLCVSLLAGAGCGAGGGGESRVHSGEVDSGVGRERLQVGDAQGGAAVVNRFGVDLLAPELGEDKGNVALSPWSVATALGMGPPVPPAPRRARSTGSCTSTTRPCSTRP